MLGGLTNCLPLPFTDAQTNIRVLINQSGNLDLNIRSENNFDIMVRIFDLSGKEMIKRQLSIHSGENSLFLPAGHLEKGIYLINISGQSFSQTIKFVK